MALQRRELKLRLHRRLGVSVPPPTRPVASGQFAHPQHLGRLDVRRPAGVSGVRLVRAIVDLPLDVDAVALAQVLLYERERRRQGVPDHHPVPLRLLLRLAVAVVPPRVVASENCATRAPPEMVRILGSPPR
jgi:hypothetical protein